MTERIVEPRVVTSDVVKVPPDGRYVPRVDRQTAQANALGVIDSCPIPSRDLARRWTEIAIAGGTTCRAGDSRLWALRSSRKRGLLTSFDTASAKASPAPLATWQGRPLPSWRIASAGADVSDPMCQSDQRADSRQGVSFKRY